MNWFMYLERAAIALGIYRHYESKSGYAWQMPEGWINRITRYERGELASEYWLIRLPSWGMEYQLNLDEYKFSQRYIAWDSVSGKKRYGGIPV
jgi:hypothetical protein